ncbi:6778_t:CDS:2 [Paraglomus occultum]|uniref:Eukaryotic translation initiation factor 3 subunit M n=1 Tax=Paraglomus occultum TaxID=144539 RepID=A0A9N8VIV6_9GLOM|nr:6778_t:CDS:2 [Paraglomus occultum]
MEYVNTVFTEGPLEEQIRDFAVYLTKLKQEDGAFVTSINTLLDEKKYDQVFSTFASEASALLDAPEKEFEPMYNLLIVILQSASPEARPVLVKTSIKALVDDDRDKTIAKLKVLQNFYNTLESTSPLRYDVFLAVLTIAAKNDEIDTILPQLPRLDVWVKEWAITKQQERELYLIISDNLKEAGEAKESYDFLLKYLATFNGSDNYTEAKIAATRALTEAIQLPEILSFENLVELDAVKTLKDEKLFELLKIFLGSTLKEYKTFTEQNPGLVEKLGLSNEDNIRKIRLLTLASISSGHVGTEISYSDIARALEIDENEVEMWTIDVIRAKLLEAKLNQVNRTILVNRSTYRTFTKEQWMQLADRLAGWQESLADILQVVANAKLIVQHANVNANIAATTPLVVAESNVNGQEDSGQ